jgi:methyltransferase
MHLSPPLILGLVVAVAAQRLAELALARRWLRLSAAETAATPERDPTYPLLVALHTAWLAGCAAEPLLWTRAVPPPLAWGAAGAWLLAMALRGWTLGTLGRYWHVRIIRRGRQPIVTGGPYRFVRHPNYGVVIVEIAAVPLLLGAYGTALAASAVNAVVLAARIRREEAYLFEVPGYREAFAHKARLLPGVF